MLSILNHEKPKGRKKWEKYNGIINNNKQIEYIIIPIIE